MDQKSLDLRAQLLVFGVACVTWLLSLGNGYAHDDTTVAAAVLRSGEANPFVSEFLPLSEYFTSHYWAATLENDVLFRPVTIISYALRGATIGDVAWVDHAVNVLLHALSSVLVGRLAVLCGASARAALWAGIGFAAMAVHAEAVANVVGRAELLAFAFGAGGTVLVAGSARAWQVLLAALLFLAGFCSKESAVAWFPFVILLGWHRRCRGFEFSYRSCLAAVVPAILAWFTLRQMMIAGLAGAPTAAAFTTNPLFAAPMLARMAGGIEAMGLGALLSVVPAWLCSEWGLAVFDPRVLPRTLTFVALLPLGLWLTMALLRWRRQALLFFSAVAFFGFAFPLSNILVPIGVPFAERLYYAASLGVAMLLAFVVDRFGTASSARPRVVLGVCALWILANFAVAQWRTPHWKDSRTIFLTDVERQPRSVNLRLFASLEEMSRGGESGVRASLEHVQAALEIDDSASAVWTALAGLQSSAGALDDAIASLQRALRSDNYSRSRDGDLIWQNLGALHNKKREDEEAIRCYVRALQLNHFRTSSFEALVELFTQKRIEADVLMRLIEQSAKRAESERPSDPWEAYRLLTRRLITGSLADVDLDRLRVLLARMPRGVFAKKLKTAIRAVLSSG